MSNIFVTFRGQVIQTERMRLAGEKQREEDSIGLWRDPANVHKLSSMRSR